MEIVKKICFTFAGILSLLLIYYFLGSIPLLPAVSVYLVAFLINKYCNKGSLVSLFIVSAFGVVLYAAQLVATIRYYPQYGNWLACIICAIQVIAIISAFLIPVSFHTPASVSHDDTLDTAPSFDIVVSELTKHISNAPEAHQLKAISIFIAASPFSAAPSDKILKNPTCSLETSFGLFSLVCNSLLPSTDSADEKEKIIFSCTELLSQTLAFVYDMSQGAIYDKMLSRFSDYSGIFYNDVSDSSKSVLNVLKAVSKRVCFSAEDSNAWNCDSIVDRSDYDPDVACTVASLTHLFNQLASMCNPLLTELNCK